MAARSLTLNINAAYRGRRSFQALRQDVKLTARSMAIISSSALGTINSLALNVDNLAGRLLRLGQITAVIFTGTIVQEVFRAGAAFDQAFANVRAVTKGTEADFHRLEIRAKELGITTKFSADQAAEAMEKLSLAGFTVNQIYDVMPSVMNFAAAGVLDVDEAARLASDTMFQMGFAADEFAHAADVMAKAAINSNQTIRDIAQAFTFVGPVARAAGVSFEEVNTAQDVLDNRGKGAERAGTGLRRILTVLIGDLEEGEKGLDGLGLQLTKADGTLISLSHSLGAVAESGVSVIRILEAMGQRAGPAFLALLSAGKSELDRFNELLIDVDGTIKDIAEKRLNSFKGQLTLMTSAFRGLAIEIFDRFLPGMVKMIQAWTDFFRASNNALEITARVSGLVRAFRLLGFAIGVVLAIKFVRGFIALGASIRIIEAAATDAAIEIGILRNSVKLTTVAFAAMRGAIALVAGVIAFQLTRAILDMLGLNPKIEAFFAKWVRGSGDVRSEAQALELELSTIQRAIARFGDLGIELPDLEGIDRFKVLMDIGEFVNVAHLDEAMQKVAGSISATHSELIGLLQQFNFLKEQTTTAQFAEVWAKAGEETSNFKERLAEAIRLVQDLKIEEDRAAEARQAHWEKSIELFKKVKEATREALVLEGFIDAKQLELIQAELFGIQRAAEESGASLSAVAIINSERLKELAQALAKSGIDLTTVFEPAEIALLRLGEQAEDGKESAKALAKEWRNFEAGISAAGLATEAMGNALADTISPVFEEIKNQAGDTRIALQAYAEEIVAMIDALRAAGQDIDPFLLANEGAARFIIATREAAEEYAKKMEEMQAIGENFRKSWERTWLSFRDAAIGSFANVIGDAIVGLRSFSEAATALMKNLVSQLISLLIQWGIQRLIIGAKIKAITAVTQSQQMAGALAQVYANAFAATAIIPIVGPALAPIVAATALALATAGAGAAAVTGAALGGSFVGLAEGGIVRKPTLSLIGEAGPEAVIPLRGVQARNAFAEIGAASGGQQPIVIQNTINLNGDNWSEDGTLPPGLDTVIRDSVSEGIKIGLFQAFPVEAT